MGIGGSEPAFDAEFSHLLTLGSVSQLDTSKLDAATEGASVDDAVPVTTGVMATDDGAAWTSGM